MNQIWPTYKRAESRSRTPSPKTLRRRYGECNTCKNPNTHENWCQKCNAERFRENFNNWTSGSPAIDKFIRDIQLSARNNGQIIEWIPYNRLREIKFVARGGFAQVYHAVWIDGFIKKWDEKKGQWERMCNWKVALKTLESSKDLNFEFFEEVRVNFMKNM